MTNWSELQNDVLVQVAKRLNLIEDYLNFGTVCKSWRSVATKDNFNSDLPRVPWLMLAEEEGNDDSSCRNFFSLYNGMILKKNIPKAIEKRCMECMGWLISAGKDEGEICLLHPFSGVHIELPHPNTTKGYLCQQTQDPWTFFHKAVLSANPSKTSDYVLMVIEANNKYLSYWRPGHLRWTRIKEEASLLRDVVYFNGKFYAIRWLGDVLVCDFTGGDPTEAQKVARLPRHQVGDEQYIVESLGSLFVVARHGGLVKSRIPLTPDYEVYDDEVDEKLTFETRYFRVYKVDLAAGKLTETKELGDRAIFLGANASLSVQASQFPGVKPNHIYFTDDNYVMYCSYLEGGGLDMGVFNIEDDTIEPHYKGVSLSRYTPPTWVTPTLY